MKSKRKKMHVRQVLPVMMVTLSLMNSALAPVSVYAADNSAVAAVMAGNTDETETEADSELMAESGDVTENVTEDATGNATGNEAEVKEGMETDSAKIDDTAGTDTESGIETESANEKGAESETQSESETETAAESESESETAADGICHVSVHVVTKANDSGRILSGGSYALMEADKIIETIESDDSGELVFVEDLMAGQTYTVREISAPKGFVTTGAEQTFIVEAPASEETADPVYEMFFEKEPTRLVISKTDVTGKQAVPGAELNILDADDQVVVAWTSKDKEYEVTELPVGSYTLHEEQAPKGYMISHDVSFTITDTAKIQYVAMKNEKAMGRIILNMTDSDTGRPLTGAVFAVTDSKGKTIEKLTTDAAGHAESRLLDIAQYEDGRMGSLIHYELTETLPADGYEANSSRYDLTFDYADDLTPVIEVLFDLDSSQAENLSQEAESAAGNSQTLGTPETGDAFNAGGLIGLLIVSVAAMISALASLKIKNGKEKEEDR